MVAAPQYHSSSGPASVPLYVIVGGAGTGSMVTTTVAVLLVQPLSVDIATTSYVPLVLTPTDIPGWVSPLGWLDDQRIMQFSQSDVAPMYAVPQYVPLPVTVGLAGAELTVAVTAK
jgi:hypothetical protein